MGTSDSESKSTVSKRISELASRTPTGTHGIQHRATTDIAYGYHAGCPISAATTVLITTGSTAPLIPRRAVANSTSMVPAGGTDGFGGGTAAFSASGFQAGGLEHISTTMRRNRLMSSGLAR